MDTWLCRWSHWTRTHTLTASRGGKCVLRRAWPSLDSRGKDKVGRTLSAKREKKLIHGELRSNSFQMHYF